MQIEKDKAIAFHYRLSEGSELLEESYGMDPVAYLHGQGNWFEEIEAAFVGKQAGDKFEVTLTAQQAYGERREDAIQRIPIKHLQGAKQWKAGMVAIVESDQGRREVTVVKVGKFNADCDLNHPFAGKTLDFFIEVISVRDATQEELAHGHIHGAGGCDH